jgi:urea carboxylase
MFDKVLIANRGEIAVRILRTLRRMNVRSVAVYSDADRHAPHVLGADESIALGGGSASETYLRQDKLLAAAAHTGAQAIHPGYGFLSENADFAQACASAGIVFIGPTPLQMRDFGLKHRARELAARSGVNLLPGSGLLESVDQARTEAARLGYPLMLKSTAGGGGIGMQLIREESQLPDAFEAVERLAAKAFSSGGMFLEKYIERARHIEVQIFGDGAGTVIALGERDCSSQRRNQKIIEETPAPDLSDARRAEMCAASVRLGLAVNYQSAGTVEFVYDAATQEFYFLEVNTRLQVEHGVTEEVTGIDLVEWMIRQAAGELPALQTPVPHGAAIQVRVYAEDPARAFRPSSGLITEAQFAPQARNESWVESGTEVTPLYDPLLAKIITSGKDRGDALLNMRKALAVTTLAGIETNLEYLRQLIASDLFAGGGMTTRALEHFVYRPRTVEVLHGGTQSTLQDYPGRVGYWNVGVPPSGPMDDWSFRLGNQALGNRPSAVALEMTLTGAALRFNSDAWVCLTGAQMNAEVEGIEAQYWTPFQLRAGQTLRLGDIRGEGCRTYLCIQHGFEVPQYLGSCSTFTLGKFGGHGGRALVAGDVLHIAKSPAGKVPAPALRRTIPPALRPTLESSWEIGVLDGPHGAPDFFTRDDIEAFYAGSWEVHYNSSRTGVRLIGAKPTWARSDGGEAGLHPSNIHDNAYAIGAVDFTGDMPVILGPDGPSLGGFVCPVTVVKSELWKLGQLRPNNRLRFRRLTPDEAAFAEADHATRLDTLQEVSAKRAAARGRRVTTAGNGPNAAVVARLTPRLLRPAVVYRRAGDRYLLVEYGPLVLDLELRLRVHALMTWLNAVKPEGIIELTPGIRSLQVHYDSRILPLDSLLDLLVGGEEALPAIDAMEIPSRIVNLPLSWDDAATQRAIEKYMQSVRADAPWCPSNIEFIRRINGLESVEQVKAIVYDASYLVMGLGDVYLGAPVCTPLDPRHRLVTTKYNPARTWTPENAVGIGGAYLCVYGMEGPGGYQFVGRTCQMWNTFRVSAEFTNDEPWLLRFFDQVRFYPVSHSELTEFRRDFLYGQAQLKIHQDRFRLADYRAFLSANADSITAAKARQQGAFEAERGRWEATGQIGYTAELPPVFDAAVEEQLQRGHIPVVSPVSGSVWRVVAAVGERVKAGETLVLIESMKMELPVTAPLDGIVTQLRCAEGRAVQVAQTLLIFEPFESRAPHTSRASLGD